MSDLDEVIASLRLKLAAAEEQKRRTAEVEAEKKANPLKTLETNLTQARKESEYLQEKKRWIESIHARQRVADLEPILEMLKQIDERLDGLERKTSTSEPKRTPVRHNNDVTITL